MNVSKIIKNYLKLVPYSICVNECKYNQHSVISSILFPFQNLNILKILFILKIHLFFPSKFVCYIRYRIAFVVFVQFLVQNTFSLLKFKIWHSHVSMLNIDWWGVWQVELRKTRWVIIASRGWWWRSGTGWTRPFYRHPGAVFIKYYPIRFPFFHCHISHSPCNGCEMHDHIPHTEITWNMLNIEYFSL